MELQLSLLVVLFFFISAAMCSPSSEKSSTSIMFATMGRSSYSFDIYTLPLPTHDWKHVSPSPNSELKLTDGNSVNFNGYFPSSPPLLSKPHNHHQTILQTRTLSNSYLNLIYVTERNGSSAIYYDAVVASEVDESHGERFRSTMETQSQRIQVPLVEGDPSHPQQGNKVGVSMKDRPILVPGGEELIYVSTHEDPGVPRSSWTAVYSTHLGRTSSTRRLTPTGTADFSPAVSPSGQWVAVASYDNEEGRGWDGEVEELNTDIFVFSSRDGSNRVKVVEHGGWPAWGDDRTLYFHRRHDEDGWWSVYRAILPQVGVGESFMTASVVVERVTPPGLHAFTPAAAASGNGNFIAVATRRAGSDYRQVELFDLVTKEFRELTKLISPTKHHFNPFLSSDGTRIGYHRCRDICGGENGKQLFLETLQNPRQGISLFRVDGSFPSFSPTGDRIAYVGFPGVFVCNSDGTNRQAIYSGTAFSTAWDPVRKGVVYTSTGPTFASESTHVDVISIEVDDDDNTGVTYRKLTSGGENNAFPSPSPDGKWVVFRSGRSGHKNLYIMDAIDGEAGYIRQLTRGAWSDTMANWSPDGEWIAFASDRERPGSGNFAIYMIRPDGRDVKKVVESGIGGVGRVNHPWFSPDGKSLVFTSDYGGVSAEPISNAHHYQPYGEIFVIWLEESPAAAGIVRLTHNSYEDGTPTWGAKYMKPVDVVLDREGDGCDFEDCHWLNANKPVLGNQLNSTSA